MRKSHETKYHQVEKAHWWCVSRRDLINRLLKSTPRSAAILEVGCASGLLVNELREKKFTNVHGIDTSAKAIGICKQQGIENCQVMDGTNTSFPSKSFDMIIASDVLEHIENDEHALREWSRILKPGGRLIMFVPAHQFLWSKHDESNNHYRRYSAKKVKSMLKDAHLESERISYWNALLFVPALFSHAFSHTILRRVQLGRAFRLPKAVNAAIFSLLYLENLLISSFNSPVGVSLFTVARKR